MIHRRTLLKQFLLGSSLFGLGGKAGYELKEKALQKGCSPFPPIFPANPYPLKAAHSQRLRLLILGDTGTGDEPQRQVAEAMFQVHQKKPCDAVLLLGDNFYPDGILHVKDSLFQTHFELIYQNLDLPFYPVLGNHDVRSDVLPQILYSFTSPKWNFPAAEYRLQTECAVLHAINTNCPLLPWFSLQEQLKRTANLPWRIAYGHHPLYSTGTHGDLDGTSRWVWHEFVANQIDFYFSGHSHYLAHLRREGYPTEYFVSGAGGKNYRDPSEKARLQPSEATAQFEYFDNGFLYAEFTKAEAKLIFYDQMAQPIYEFTKSRGISG